MRHQNAHAEARRSGTDANFAVAGVACTTKLAATAVVARNPRKILLIDPRCASSPRPLANFSVPGCAKQRNSCYGRR